MLKNRTVLGPINLPYILYFQVNTAQREKTAKKFRNSFISSKFEKNL